MQVPNESYCLCIEMFSLICFAYMTKAETFVNNVNINRNSGNEQ